MDGPRGVVKPNQIIQLGLDMGVQNWLAHFGSPHVHIILVSMDVFVFPKELNQLPLWLQASISEITSQNMLLHIKIHLPLESTCIPTPGLSAAPRNLRHRATLAGQLQSSQFLAIQGTVSEKRRVLPLQRSLCFLFSSPLLEPLPLFLSWRRGCTNSSSSWPGLATPFLSLEVAPSL
ncbi:hypothetical protein VNO77_34562 [Canavalia gladiata]|uniref:Uncharacterized protein n=1 Tax=Canavalia gladiata TaxID=3824 RepID=A0AAN9PZC2_CANGL